MAQVATMSHGQVVKYLTKIPRGHYYKHDVASLKQDLSHAEAVKYLNWLILLNDRDKSDFQAVKESSQGEISSLADDSLSQAASVGPRNDHQV